MRILMNATIASPKVNAIAGQIVDVPEKQAVNLVGKGYAEYCKETVVETATIEPVQETAATRISKPKKRKVKDKRTSGAKLSEKVSLEIRG